MSARIRRALRAARAARGLPLRDALIVVLAGALIVWYRLRLALPRPWGDPGLLVRQARPWTAGPACGMGDRGAAGRLAELFRRAAEHAVVSASCAPRSLALARLLRLHGLAAEVRIGLRRAGRELAGHAWVEHHGVSVGEDATFVSAFTPLAVSRRSRHGEVE